MVNVVLLYIAIYLVLFYEWQEMLWTMFANWTHDAGGRNGLHYYQGLNGQGKATGLLRDV